MPSQLTLPNGAAITRDYNTTHGLSQTTSSSAFSSSVTLSVAYDSLLRITRQVRNYDYATGYTYDRLGRVTSESSLVNNSPPPSCDGNPPPIIDEYGNQCVSGYGWTAFSGTTFSYDSVGNRRDHGGTYGAGNRITAFDGCSYATDADGNVTWRLGCADSVRFYWSAESRLDSLTRLGARIAFRYDAAGRLVQRDSAGAAQRYFLWDGENLVAELGAMGATKVAEYSYYSTDRLHALIVGTTPYYAHQEARGNTIALTDASLRRAYDYDAWGE